jgi:glutathione S-transferase
MLEFYHSPNTRSTGVRILLDELGVEYRLHTLDMPAGENRQPAFLAVNPMGKVPAIVHDGALVTEQGAIYLYLADAFPAAGLAPAIGDPLRGPYVRWLAFYGSAFEPAVVDRAMQREPGRVSMSPYGDFDTMMGTVTAQLGAGPYLLGARFSAADVLWGMAMGWMTQFKLVPEHADITAYVARLWARPSVARVRALDGELAADQAAAAGRG